LRYQLSVHLNRHSEKSAGNRCQRREDFGPAEAAQGRKGNENEKSNNDNRIRSDAGSGCVSAAFRGIDWGRALAELSAAISEQRPPRATGEHAAHVVEILDAVETSVRDGKAVDVTSTFAAPPAPTGARPAPAGDAVAATRRPRKVTQVIR
jgi:hypothetical protein